MGINIQSSNITAMLFVCLLSALFIIQPSSAVSGTTGNIDSFGVSVEMKLKPDVDTTGFSGEANITIPIAIPPGRANVMPDLKLTYSSSAGNGWIGLGWDIGIGSIQRQTRFGLDYNNNNDGNGKSSFVFQSPGASGDLVFLGSGNYGLKIETNFARFSYVSGAWVVTAKDGTKYYYGTTQDSQQRNSSSQTYKWCLDKILDTNGNFMTISYLSDNGEIYVSEIRYTGNGSTQPTNFVKFYYMGRSDSMTYGIGPNLVKVRNLLRAIEITASGTKVGIYGFEYQQAYHTQEPILYKVIQYDGNATYSTYNYQITGGTSLPPIVITFYNNEIELPAGGHSPESHALPGYKYIIGDFDGNGRADYMWIAYNSNKRVVYLSTGSGAFNGNSSTANYSYSATNWSFATGDFNGDGKTDYLMVNKAYNNECHVYLSNGSGFPSTPVITAGNVTGNKYSTWLFFTGDFNCDGRTDIMYINPVDGQRAVHLNGGSGTFNSAITGSATGSSYATARFVTGDFNDDGKTDYMAVHANGAATEVFLSNGSGGFTKVTSSGGYYANIQALKFETGDFNGDGKTDYMWVNAQNNTTYTYLATGNGQFASPETSSAGGNYAGLWDLYTGDFNGDGKTDILWGKAGSNPVVYLSKGNGTFSSAITSSATFPSGSWKFAAGDFNGDGRADMIFLDAATSTTNRSRLVALTNPTTPKSLLQSIKNMTGGTTTFEYKSSASFSNTMLPYVMPLVTKLTRNDGLGNTAVTQYHYEKGLHNYPLREFWGFGYVKTTQPDGSTIEVNYHQDEYLKGRMKNATLKNPGGLVLKADANTTTAVTLSSTIPRWKFVKLDLSKTTYDNNASYYTQNKYTYQYSTTNPMQSHGGVTRIVTSGTGAETITTDYAYANFGTWVWRKTSETLTGASSGAVRKTTYDYFSTTGNLKAEKKWDLLNEAASRISTMEYYANGNLWKQTDPRGFVTETEYETNANTFPGQIKRPATAGGTISHITKYLNYDYRFGKPREVVDENNKSTYHTYDGFGRLKQIDHPDGGQTQVSYYDSSFPRWEITCVKEDASSNINTYQYYDGFDRNIQTVAFGEGNKRIVTKTYYDNMGRVRQVNGPYFSGTGTTAVYPLNEPSNYAYVKTTYDYRGRILTKTNPDDEHTTTVTGYTYTVKASGFFTTIADPEGKRKEEKRDHLGRILQVTEDAISGGMNLKTYYTYNAAGDLLTIRDAATPVNVTTINYNSFGQKADMTDPDRGKWFFTYDPNGNMRTQKDAKGQVITFDYDELNRILTKDAVYTGLTCPNGGSLIGSACEQSASCTGSTCNCPAGWTLSGKKCTQAAVVQTITEPRVTYTYDHSGITNGRGRLHSVTNTKVTTTILGYDPMGRKLGEKRSYVAEGTNYDTWYAYDLAGKITGMTYPDNYQIAYSYYPGTGLYKSVTGVSDGKQYALYTLYEPTGKIGQITHDNGSATRYTYGPKSTRLYGIVTTSAGADLQNTGYKYTKAADVYQVIDHLRGVTYTYTYDNLHRLKGETNTGAYPANTYVYDAIGNITRKTTGTNSYNYSYSYPQKHAVSAIAFNGGTAMPFSYDANGNMLAGPDFTDTAVTGTRTVTYTMDNMPSTLTYTKNANTTVSEFTYDGSNMRAKKKVNGSTTYYVNADYEVKDAVVTKYISAADMKVAQVKGTEVSYYHKDHLNSSTVMTNASGTKVEETAYAPYGTMRAFTGTAVTNYRYTGKEIDPETNLYYYGARYYDPMMGRFITADSIVSDIYDPQDLNRYAYCRNNPMIYVDPDGHAADTVWDLVNIGMGIASFAYNVKTGNVSGAIVDAVGIVGDSAAAVVPFLPGGVATGIKAYRAADTAADALKAARKGGAAVEQTAKAGSKVALAGGNAAISEVRTFRHYGYAEDAIKFEGGLKPGSYATHGRGRPMHGKTAQEKLALPHETPPDAYYKVRVGTETPVIEHGTVRATDVPKRPGGGIEYTFPEGTPSGSVNGPFPIPR